MYLIDDELLQILQQLDPAACASRGRWGGWKCKKPCKGVFGLKIQEGKIRIATADRCVMCGEIIPEGQQVCGLCKYKVDNFRFCNGMEWLECYKKTPYSE